ncbi:MAG: CheR family methyltransferase [Lentisphaerota bacterium]
MTEESLELLSAKVKSFSGLHYPKDRFQELAKSMANFLKQSDAADPKNVMDSFEAMSDFCVFLTLGETYFFRHKSHFEYIVNYVKNKIESHYLTPCDEIRIWSAACSTGEEPYSIAIALKDAGLYDYGVEIHIFASDMNPSSIYKAKTAIYSDWAFRENSDEIKDKYFTKVSSATGGATRFRSLDPKIKSKVEFFRNNLITTSVSKKDVLAKPFDIIMCRNAMIYFSYDIIKDLGQLFFSMLNNGGSLIVSPAETSLMSNLRLFKGVDIGSSFVFEKKPHAHTIKTAEAAIPPPKPKIIVAPLPPPKKAIIAKTAVEMTKSKIEPTKLKTDMKSLYASRRYGALIDNYSQEISDLLKKLSLTDNQSSSIKLYIRSLIYESMLDDAEKICAKALEIQKLDLELHFLNSKILIETEKTTEAIKQLKKVIFLDSKNLMGHYLLGNLLLSENSKSMAKKHFENVLSILSSQSPDRILEEADGSTVKEIQMVTHSILATLTSETIS